MPQKEGGCPPQGKNQRRKENISDVTKTRTFLNLMKSTLSRNPRDEHDRESEKQWERSTCRMKGLLKE